MDEGTAFRTFEAQGWERQAPTYDDFLGRITHRLVDPLLDAAGVRAGTRVLDVATGSGHVAAGATGRGAAAVGVDVASAMVALARRRHPGVDFRVGDAEALPDGSFDAAVANFLVPHLAHHDRAVAELARVLVPGGRLALTTWDVPDRTRLFGVFLDAFDDAGAQPPPDLPVGPPFFRYADDKLFAGLLRDGGLVDVTVQTVAFDHRVSTAAQLWDGILTSTVRTASFVTGQTPEMRAGIRTAFERRVEPYGGVLPVSVKLASGGKPLKA
jgi:SAM-dependent methyltransferase